VDLYLIFQFLKFLLHFKPFLSLVSSRLFFNLLYLVQNFLEHKFDLWESLFNIFNNLVQRLFHHVGFKQLLESCRSHSTTWMNLQVVMVRRAVFWLISLLNMLWAFVWILLVQNCLLSHLSLWCWRCVEAINYLILLCLILWCLHYLIEGRLNFCTGFLFWVILPTISFLGRILLELIFST